MLARCFLGFARSHSSHFNPSHVEAWKAFPEGCCAATSSIAPATTGNPLQLHFNRDSIGCTSRHDATIDRAIAYERSSLVRPNRARMFASHIINCLQTLPHTSSIKRKNIVLIYHSVTSRKSTKGRGESMC